MSMARVGVLALQGDVREHIRIFESLGVAAKEVKKPELLQSIDALVIPGGESTTIGKLAVRFGLLEPLRETIGNGLPVYGTCAGMILLAGAVTEGDQPLIGALDVVVERNAFGRQNESFEADLDIDGLDEPFHAVFIRAPWIDKVGSDVEILSEIDEHPVMVRQGKILATSFHPELTGDERIHRMLLDLI
ncbi:MAG TPA: pyridoxal 5'-phosphate synthase glutaminase subunit PdxT [Acidimicrobiia bacterium]|nr:pyridoxal 5'-phosphate synthase glutaminase subunit PdxT [Acidimicrobiia bacterium]